MGGRTELLPLSGYAFTLCASGKGRITVFDGKVKRSIAFDSESKTVKGILFGEGSLEFSGEYSYDVFGITVFSEPYFSDVGEIPSSECERFVDMRERVDDFLKFAGEVTDTEGNLISDIVLSESKIFFPEGFSGAAVVSYYRNLKSPELSAPDSAIDIPKEYESLLPLLCASYLLLDSDSEKAEYYRQAYLRSVAEIKRRGTFGEHNAYLDVNGWA